MIRDGIYYGLALAAAAALLGWLAGPYYSLPPLLLATFFLWFFRDPDRVIPAEPGALVAPADGKVTAISNMELGGKPYTRVSIFLSVFDVHVNRAPIAGVVHKVEYRRGQFRNAIGAASAETNEQNIVTLAGDGQTVVFKQIAGVLARRIVFSRRVGERVERGERVGLIKFGSRVDAIFDAAAKLNVALGQHVRGGASVLAHLPPAASREAAESTPAAVRGGGP